MTPAQREKWKKKAEGAPPCPSCNSTNIVPVGYGVEDFIASKESDLVVCHGGHIVFGVSPIWACKDCKTEFGVIPATAECPLGSEMFVD